MKRAGKMITIYGINGIGKTTQVDLLVKYLQEQGLNASRLKYPIYSLAPEGPFINDYLRDPDFRQNNPLSTHELQYQYSRNRLRYQPTLLQRLEVGEWIIAEDYTGTGIAWGLTWGGDLGYLETINSQLHKEDLAILLDGDRFLTAIEPEHRNESDSERINICKNFLRLLAERYTWVPVNANRDIHKVASKVHNIAHSLII
jgi:thymidylate kinase